VDKRHFRDVLDEVGHVVVVEVEQQAFWSVPELPKPQTIAPQKLIDLWQTASQLTVWVYIFELSIENESRLALIKFGRLLELKEVLNDAPLSVDASLKVKEKDGFLFVLMRTFPEGLKSPQ